jgi:hypothetical protein
LSEYRTVVKKFANEGTWLKPDIDLLQDGQYQYLQNVTSIQEGSICARLGSTRTAVPSLGEAVHTIQDFRIGATPDAQYLYFGEGSDVYRARLDALGTTTKIIDDFQSWGERWTGIKYNAGGTGKPYFYIAGTKSYKDKAVSDSGTQTTDAQDWGIIPPPGTPSATLVTPLEKNIFTGPTSRSWTGSQSNTYLEIPGLPTSAINLGEFASASEPSGFAIDHYNNSDYIEISITPTAPSKFSEILLQFDVSGGAYTSFYQKSIIFSQLTAVINQTASSIDTLSTRAGLSSVGILGNQTETLTPVSDAKDQVSQDQNFSVAAITQDPVGSFGAPAEADPAPDTNQPRIVRIAKKEFLAIGNADTGTNDWASVNGVRIYAKSADATGGISLAINYIKLVGGGGPDSSAAASNLYRYIYTYRNDETAFESNPCPVMLSQRYCDPHRQKVIINGIITSPDPQVTRIAMYRAGGTFADTLYRFVGYCANTVAVTFTDELADADIVGARTVEFDNDPPVSSQLKTALSATIGSSLVVGYNTVALSIDSPPGVSASAFLTNGTRLTLQDQEKTEEVQIIGTPSGNNITIICQQPHDTGIRVSTNVVANKPCYLGCLYDDSMILAGDRDNPHVLYKSKRGRPEAFPLLDFATGNVNQIAITSPSNPINAVTEFGGELVGMCLNNIYIVRIFSGAFQTPLETPASRGLLAPHAWCKADNELIYLSKDGVYAWSGGDSQKLSEPIDWFFKGITVNGVSPMNMSDFGLTYVRMAYHNNEVHFICQDTTSTDSVKLRYHTIYKRWSFDKPGPLSGVNTWTSIHATPTTLYSARAFSPDCFIYVEDDPTNTLDGETPFACVVHCPYFNLGDPTLQKQWGDILSEITATGNITLKTYFDYAAAVDQTLTINGASGRRMIPIPIQSANAKQARTMSMRFEFNSADGSQMTLHSVTFNVLALANIQRGRAEDWTDGGYPHDKRLDQVWIDYDAGGSPISMRLDVLSGLNGNSQTDAIYTFALDGNRGQPTIPLKKTSDGSMIICKKMRLRPAATVNNFTIFERKFTFAEYPPDITLFTDPSDYGNPYDKYWNELVIDVDTGGVAATIDIYIDSAGVPNQTLIVNTTQATRQQRLTLYGGIIGKKARMIFNPGTNGKFQLFSHNFTTTPQDKGPVMHSWDWDDLGWKWDKRLYSVTFEYEAPNSTSILIEGSAGVGSNVTYTTIATLALEAGSRRTRQYTLPDGAIYKMVRFTPANSATPVNTVKIYKPDWEFEKYPRDVVQFTEPTDGGNPYDKYYQQLDLQVDTGGVSASVIVEIDGTTVQTIPVTTTALNRNRNLTLNPGITGKISRILATPGSGGKFQLFHHAFITAPADKGPVFHTYDWDDLGHPYDKRLQSVTFEYDVTENTTMNMYLIVGITGAQQQIGPYPFTLSASGRKLETFDFPDTFVFPQGSFNMIAKSVRFQPAADNINMKSWKYTFNKINMPMDTTRKTDWDSLGANCEFLLRGLKVDADTGGQSVTVIVDVDGTTKSTYPLTMTTNAKDRVRFFSFDYEIICRQVRIMANPTAGAKFQLFDYKFEKVDEPCPYLKWDSYEQNYGSSGYKFMKQIWLEYKCASAINFYIYTDENRLLHTEVLPPHAYRDVERFFLPDISSNGLVLNKSKSYKFILESADSTNPFYMYRDASRIETLNLSADQRRGYYQNYIWTTMPIPV